MTKISGSTIYFKRVFPTIWFGFLAFFLAIGVSSGATDVMFLVMPIIMGIGGFALFKNLVWDLADEVILPTKSGHPAKRVNYRKAEVDHDQADKQTQDGSASTHARVSS